MKYQVTIMHREGKYKPLTTIVEVAEGTTPVEIKKKGIVKICQQKYLTKRDLIRQGFASAEGKISAKVRPYEAEDVERYKAEVEARYEAIKEAKYASGEWKRPKGK